MSAVLRKKIESAAGVPPSVLEIRAFWHDMGKRIEAWSLELFDVRCHFRPTGYKVIGGKSVAPIIESPNALFFGATASPGLCAIIMDPEFAIRNAAKRMRQDPASLQGASPLFLKLLFEQPAGDLWRRIATELTDHDLFKGAAPQPDATFAAGGFVPESRYLQTEFSAMLEDRPLRLLFVFQLEFMQRFARTYLRREADRKEEACSQSPRALTRSVRASAVELDAVLHRFSLSIGQCTELEIGTVLPLANVDPAQLWLSADTINGSVDIGSGELGVWKQRRAVKLRTPIASSFAREIVDL